MNVCANPAATVLIHGMPHETVTRIVFDATEGVTIVGRAFAAWDRNALIDNVVSACGSRGDIAATNAAGVHQEMSLAKVGLSSVQVGCAAGAVLIAAFQSTPDAQETPVAFAAAVSTLVNSLLRTAGNEIEPVVIASMCGSTADVVSAAQTFGLQTFDCGTSCIAFSRTIGNNETHVMLEPVEPADQPFLQLTVMLCTPKAIDDETQYGDALFAPRKPVASQKSPVQSRNVQVGAAIVLMCVIFGIWIFMYPNNAPRTLVDGNASNNDATAAWTDLHTSGGQ